MRNVIFLEEQCKLCVPSFDEYIRYNKNTQVNMLNVAKNLDKYISGLPEQDIEYHKMIFSKLAEIIRFLISENIQPKIKPLDIRWSRISNKSVYDYYIESSILNVFVVADDFNYSITCEVMYQPGCNERYYRPKMEKIIGEPISGMFPSSMFTPCDVKARRAEAPLEFIRTVQGSKVDSEIDNILGIDDYSAKETDFSSEDLLEEALRIGDANGTLTQPEEDEVFDLSGSEYSNNIVPRLPEAAVEIKSVAALVDEATGKTVAIRIRSNVGNYDINIDIAKKLGLPLTKLKKGIKVRSINGMYVSKSERESHKFIEDISANLEDCRRLIYAVLNS